MHNILQQNSTTLIVEDESILITLVVI